MKTVHRIKLKGVVPHPLAQAYLEGSEVWDTQLELKEKENTLIAAHSGKGKSTLINMIYGLRKDYEGMVLFDETNINTFSIHDWPGIRQEIFSIIFQDLRLFQDYTVRENLDLSAQLFGDQYDTALEEKAIQDLGIAHIMNQKVAYCSYGERQRVAIIRGLCRPYQWLLMDEPFSHLDEKNIGIACDLIEESVQKRKATYILASLGYRYKLSYDNIVNL